MMLPRLVHFIANLYEILKAVRRTVGTSKFTVYPIVVCLDKDKL